MRTPASTLLISLALCGNGFATADEPPVADSEVPAADGAAPLDTASAAAVRTILEAGFRSRAAGAAPVEPPAEPGGRDSRVEYALGLVLLKQLKHREAVAAFRAAADSRPPYLPAWQALVRTQLTLKEGDAALEHAERLAAQLADGTVAWPSEECRSDAATWLGRVAGYLALDGVDLIDPPALRTAHEARVRLALDEPLRAAWSRGRESIHREHQALLKERAEARTTIAADQQQQHQDRAAEIKAQRTELDQQTETLKLTAREWQAWLDEQLRRTAKQLTILQKDFATLDAAAREVSNEIIHQQRELTSLRLRADFNVQARSAQVLPIQLQHEAIERENQVLRLQAQFDRLAAQASTVSTQARALLAERTAAARRFERATGQLARQDATLRKWNQLLDKAAGRNEPKAAADTNQYRLLNGRRTLVATYFELDTDAERKRLLAEIAAAP